MARKAIRRPWDARSVYWLRPNEKGMCDILFINCYPLENKIHCIEIEIFVNNDKHQLYFNIAKAFPLKWIPRSLCYRL